MKICVTELKLLATRAMKKPTQFAFGYYTAALTATLMSGILQGALEQEHNEY